MTEIIVNGKTYVEKEERPDLPYVIIRTNVKKEERPDLPYVIIRTNTAGVFAGYLKSRKEQEVVLEKARRIWYWKGAASLSELAMHGTCCPDECKFPCPVDKITVTEAVEIIDTTEKARKSIENVPIWTAKE